MGFSDAFLNVHFLVQRVFVIPFFYDVHSNRIEVHRKRKLPLLQRFTKMPLWITMYFVAYLVNLYCASNLVQLAKHFSKNQSSNHFLQVILFGCGIAMSTQFLATRYTMDKNPDYFTYSLREIFKCGGVHFNGFPTTERPPDFQEIMGYGIAFGLMNFPLATALIPFLIRSINPIDKIIPNELPLLPRKLLSSLFYSFVTFYSASVCATFLLLLLSACHIFEKATKVNFLLCQNKRIAEHVNRIEKLVIILAIKALTMLEAFVPNWKKWNTPVQANSKKLFQKSQNCEQGSNAINSVNRLERCRMTHNILYIMMTPCNYNVQLFIPTMAGVGIVLCIFLNFAILSLYHRADIRILFWLAVNTSLAIHWLIQFFCLHASLPAVYTEKTIDYLKAHVRGKMEKRQVWAMMPFGFSMGVFFKTKQTTALDMFQNILSYTASLMVLYK